MYDIAIIGAGPAGATLARLAGKNYKVLLIDKRAGPQVSIPACPPAQKTGHEIRDHEHGSRPDIDRSQFPGPQNMQKTG